MVLGSVAEAIGHTPLVHLRRLAAFYGVEGAVLLKLEMFNPGLSKKDRIAKQVPVGMDSCVR